MKDNLILQGKTYISSKRASEISDYTTDYIGQLCRAKKLDCQMFGHTWFVTETSLREHAARVVSEEVNVKRLGNFKGKQIKASTAVSFLNKVQQSVSEPIGALSYSSIASPYAANDATSFLPQLNKTSTQPASTVHVPITTPMELIASGVVSTIYRKRVAAVAVAAIMLIAAASGSIALFGKGSVQGNSSPLASAYDAVRSLGGFFHAAYDGTLALFGHVPALTINTNGQAVGANGASEGQGIAVIPSAGSASADATAKQDVQSEFSDQVTVQADKSGTAGVITPVFKQTTGKNFVYVLVPVKKAPEASQSAAQASP